MQTYKEWIFRTIESLTILLSLFRAYYPYGGEYCASQTDHKLWMLIDGRFSHFKEIKRIILIHNSRYLFIIIFYNNESSLVPIFFDHLLEPFPLIQRPNILVNRRMRFSINLFHLILFLWWPYWINTKPSEKILN